MPQVTVLPVPPLAHETHYGRETLVFSQRPANFNEVVAQSVTHYPEKIALVFEGRRWTYRQLMDEANAFAATIHLDYGTVELTRKNGVSKGGDAFMCNGVACSKATGLTYCNVEWVNACASLPKTRLTLSGFSPLQALTRSLHFPHPAKGASPPGRSVVDGSRRDERTRDIPQSLPRSLVSAAKPTTGIQVIRAFRPLLPQLAHS